tara:strand:- start:56 stop:856 length:801 start_codon:yes stop_codon:yes gene_type:complete
MGKYFTTLAIPDIVDGDVSDVIDADKTNKDFDAGDVVFNWVAIDVPSGTNCLKSISMWVNGEDASSHGSGAVDYELIFAKSHNGLAPNNLGNLNSAPNLKKLRDYWVGTYRFDATATISTGIAPLNHGFGYSSNKGKEDGVPGGGLPMILDLEPGSGTNVGYDRLYMAGVIVSARNFNTGVIVNGAITSDTEDTITVDGINANMIFSVGDTVYLHDVDTALGTVKSIADNGLSITLNAPIAGGTNLDDDDELVNANPFKIRLAFEK